MPASLIPSFLVYSYVGALTPGPANLCCLSTALRFGRRAALRQWRGLLLGFFLDAMAAVLVTYFLGAVFHDYVHLLSWVGAAYLLFLAWKTLRSSGKAEGEAPEAPGFWSGLLLNLTNVKVILFCLMAMTTYVLPYNRSFGSLLLVGLFMPFTGPPANLVWLFAGAALQKVFARHQKAVDRVCAAALAYCAVSLLLH